MNSNTNNDTEMEPLVGGANAEVLPAEMNKGLSYTQLGGKRRKTSTKSKSKKNKTMKKKTMKKKKAMKKKIGKKQKKSRGKGRK